MRSRFQLGLDELKSRLLEMGGMAESAIEAASQAYCQRDARQCQIVFTREKSINDAERAIDEFAVDQRFNNRVKESRRRRHVEDAHDYPDSRSGASWHGQVSRGED